VTKKHTYKYYYNFVVKKSITTGRQPASQQRSHQKTFFLATQNNMSAAMVRNPTEAATVMPANAVDDLIGGGNGGGGAPTTGGAGTALPLTTNMTASSLTSGGNSCLDEQIERLKRCEYLREGEVKALCLRAREILVDESNVQRVDAPVTVRVYVYIFV
jgi:hypothetical protein